LPIHDYVCLNCGHAMEVMHSVHGHGPAVCPQCGGPMKKTLAAPSVHYKGTGWARKERAGGRASQTASRESGSSPEEGSGTDSAPSPDPAATHAPAPAASAPSKEPD